MSSCPMNGFDVTVQGGCADEGFGALPLTCHLCHGPAIACGPPRTALCPCRLAKGSATMAAVAEELRKETVVSITA